MLGDSSKLPPKQASFTRLLVGDVTHANERIEADDPQSARRDYVRCVFSAIEGMFWRLRMDVLPHAEGLVDLTPHERAALTEETYSVDHQGAVHLQPRYIALPALIRLLVKIIQRMHEGYNVDFNHMGWQNLQSAIRVRNRLTHPKSIDDLHVSDKDIKQCTSGFFWFLALNVEALELLRDQLAAVTELVVEARKRKRKRRPRRP